VDTGWKTFELFIPLPLLFFILQRLPEFGETDALPMTFDALMALTSAVQAVANVLFDSVFKRREKQ
jgi:hypothetical protein